MHSSINIIAAVGLALGGALGLAGAMVTQQSVQAILWAIDGAGLVMAAALLAVKYFRTGNDVVAGGFLVFAIGEGVLLSGPAARPAGSVPSFGAGTALWGTALLLVSVPKLFAMPVRILGIVSAILFIITAATQIEALTRQSPALMIFEDARWIDPTSLEAWRGIGEAMTAIEATRERSRETEIHRIAGEIALKSPEPDAAKAEAYFERALAVARQQQTESWELRAAMSMARLWRDQGKPQQARELLAPIYGWFTEGFDMLDLKEAQALLDQLASE
jgi:hypothetical protein